MPASLALVEALRARGTAAVVSGAGPTVLAMCADCDVDTLVAAAPDGWRALPLELDRAGVTGS
jgi:homoserine kinase